MSTLNMPMVSERDPSLTEDEMIQEALREHLPNDREIPSKLVEAMSYSLFSGGKRLRPAMVFAGAEAIGVDPSRVRPLAAAVEFVHTYSLIHDDLPALDDDDLRRGKPTCHRVFGEDIAIMAGDALLTEAFFIVARAQECADWDAQRSLLGAMGQALGARGMVGGQVLDLLATGEYSQGDLENIHNGKTGALIAFCMSSAAIAFGESEDVIEAISLFGRKVGLAFQIIDDVIDDTGTLEEIGKPPGSDRSSNKQTYTVLMSPAMATELAQQILVDATNALLAASANREKVAGRALGHEALLSLAHLMVHRSA